MAIGDQTGITGGTLRRGPADERRALVQRIVASRCFEKSARMRDFVAYVCNRVLDEPGAEIHEQEIGCAVFARAPNYDTGSDNIVRVNASQVRKKLETYFATEGAGERLTLVMPKGKYVPEFRERPAGVEPALEPAVPVVPSRRPVVPVLAALCVILAALSLWLAISLRQARLQPKTELEKNPDLNALWSQIIRKDMRTSIVVTDSSLGLMQDLIQRPIPLAEYIHPDRWGLAEELNAKPDLQNAARLAGRRHYTSLANLNLARRILALAGEDQSRIALQFARDFSVRPMKAENVILLGSKRANPWIELVEGQMNFRFGYDVATRQSYFENRRPRAAELPVYRNDQVVSYCQIAFLPNLDRTGNILVISGTEMEGTEVGGEFLTSEKWMSGLRKVVPPDRTGRFPNFELLLKASKIAGPASGFEIVAVRRTQ